MKYVALAALALAACSGGGDGNVQSAEPVAGTAAPAGGNWTETVSKTAEGGYVMGNPNAPIKLVEYGSRTCPTCGAFGREATRPLEDNYIKSGKVSYEFRDYLVHGAPDLAAALLGQCGGTGPFFPVLEQMYQNQAAYLDKLQQTPPAVQARLQGMAPAQAITALAEQMALIEFVKQRGVPEAKARACLADAAQIDGLTKQTQDATASGAVTGPPTFLLNGKKLENTVSWAQVEQALKAAGA